VRTISCNLPKVTGAQTVRAFLAEAYLETIAGSYLVAAKLKFIHSRGRRTQVHDILLSSSGGFKIPRDRGTFARRSARGAGRDLLNNKWCVEPRLEPYVEQIMEEIHCMVVHNNVSIRTRQSNGSRLANALRGMPRKPFRVNVDKPAPRLTIGTV
jgi:hypothetical protein